MTTAGVFSDLGYPRVLMEGVDGEGQFLCADPIDCVQKCAYLSQNSVGGMGTPAACSL